MCHYVNTLRIHNVTHFLIFTWLTLSENIFPEHRDRYRVVDFLWLSHSYEGTIVLVLFHSHQPFTFKWNFEIVFRMTWLQPVFWWDMKLILHINVYTSINLVLCLTVTKKSKLVLKKLVIASEQMHEHAGHEGLQNTHKQSLFFLYLEIEDGLYVWPTCI